MRIRSGIFLLSVFLISASFRGPSPQTGGQATPAFAAFEKRFLIELTNPLKTPLANHPIVLGIGEMMKAVPDFNPLNCALVNREGDHVIPHQSDDLNGDQKPDELAFVVSLPPGSTAIVCYYSPAGTRTMSFPVKTHARLAWEAQNANIGWESNCASYRLYYGQIEGFGKLYEYLILPVLTANYTYHNMTEWGMDILHVGDASGLGGISLWEGEKRVPAMNIGGKGDIKIDRKVLAAGPVRGLARVDFSNIRSARGEYTITLVLSAFADNFFSRQDITVLTNASREVIYSPGIEKLAGDTSMSDKDRGFLAVWGPGIEGAGEIGLGLMFSPQEYAGFAENSLDRYVKLRIPAGKTRTHWILTGWSKGLTAPAPPAAANWAKRVEELGLRLRTPIKVQFQTK
jgi:hypothetical protein